MTSEDTMELGELLTFWLEALGADLVTHDVLRRGTEVPRSAEQLFAWLAAVGTELLSDPDVRIAESVPRTTA